MSLYSARVAQDSPVLYFENNASGVNNTGSRTPTISTGSANVFNSTGGVANSPYIYVGDYNSNDYGFEYSDSTTTFNDRVFSITGWFNSAANDAVQNFNYLFHVGTTANGISLDTSSSGVYISATPNGFVNSVSSGLLTLDTWHHFAWTVDTTNMKLYIDGSLVSTTTTPSTISMDSQVKYWMRWTSSGTTRYGTLGKFDEWAVFDSTLSSTTIAEHYAAGFAVDYDADPATATALAVDPAVSAIANISIVETSATATADIGDIQVSNFNTPTMLDGYLAGRSLEQWFKFDEIGKIHNYGSGGDAELAWAFNGASVNVPEAGIQGSGALKIKGEVGNSVVLAFGVNEPYFPEITDNEFSVGVWFKAESSFKTKIPRIFVVLNPFGDDSYNLLINDVGFATWVATGTQTHTATYNTVDVCDGNWHLIQVRASDANNQIAISVDNGTEVTTAVTGNTWPQNLGYMSLGTTYDAGTNNSYGYISNMWITGYSSIGSTERAAMITAAAVPIQAAAGMVQPVVKFDNAYNILLDTYSPKIAFRLNEASGAPINFGSGGTLSVGKNGSNITYLQPTQNTYAYKFTNADTFIQGDYAYASGTFSTNNEQTMSAVFKAESTVNFEQLIGSMGMYGFLGAGITLSIGATNGYLEARINQGFGETDTDFLGTTINVCDNQYHHAVGVRDGSIFKLYLDGKEVATMSSAGTTLSDAATYAISGEGKFNFGQGSATKALHIDEFAVLSSALNANEVFGLYQSLSNATEWTASALAVQPSVATGTGTIVNSEALTASAESPFFIAPSIYAATGTGLFQQPNFEAIKNTDNLADAMTAEAQGENPGWDIGENNQVLHMDASAMMPEAEVFVPGNFNSNPGIATAEMVEPAISSTLGALIKPISLTAKAIFATPPAYILLSDDKWFTRLLEQNGDRAIEPVQSQLTNLPNQRTQDVIKGGFLAFFNSLQSDITTTNSGLIENQIPNYYFTKQDEYEYDSEGNILDVDTTKNVARAGAGRSSTTPTPLLSLGTYDDRQRKAVNINNIEFALPGTSRNYSNRYYNLEFSFKTNKKDQIVSHGFYTSPTSTSNIRRIGVVGLSDGKIYLSTDNFDPASFTFSAGISGSVTAPHPKKNAKEYLIGKTNVADGEWHHIIIQYGYEDGRTQIWVDSKLERQYNVRPEDGGTTQTNVPGFNGTNTIRPYIIGFNSSEELLRSEFETSGWNFCPGRFISSQDVLLNYAAYDNYDPIKVAPMTANTTMTEDNNGSGNKKKALLLYWWPQDRQTYLSEPQIFDTSLTTVDNPKSAPQEFEGWDVFPLSVTGRHGLSDILNESVVKTNAGYINLETGSPRMLDLMNDVDVDQFDAIFFKNYPETSSDVDEYIRNEYVDKYFGLTEKDLYEQFLISLRAAVDSGISLYVTSKQLALDLKIVKAFNFIPSFDDRFRETALSIEFPNYAGNDLRSIELTNPNNWDDEANAIKQTIALRSKYAINEQNTQYWPDRNNNMRHRVLNQIEYLTDDSTYILTDRAFYQNDDNVDFLGSNRHYQRFEYRLNGLQIGDEFVFGNPSFKTALGNTRSNQNTGFWAVHKDDILAGVPVTGQPLNYYSQNELVENPYKDYVHSIALQPGTTLDGKGLGGKIFVSISEVFWDETAETSIVDLVTDYWIDIAYENGIFGPVGSTRATSTRARYKNAEQFISPANKSSEKYDFLTYWSRNDDYAFTQTDQGDEFAGVIGLLFDDIEKVGRVPNTRSSLPSSTRARDRLGRFASGSGGMGGGTLWFKAVTGRFTPTMNIYFPNILTRGFWWLSDRIRLSGLVIRTTPMTATSSFLNANAVPDKDVAISSESMVCSATFEDPSNYSFADTKIIVLPMYASAEIVKPGKQIMATPMLAISQFKNPGIATIGEEEVVLIIDNKIAEVYIREDKIK